MSHWENTIKTASRNSIFLQSPIYIYLINSLKTPNSSTIYLKIYIFSLSVLFTFDTNFVKTFGASGMTNLIALVKKEFVGKSLKKLVGTTIKLTGTTRKFSRALKDKGSNTAHKSSRCQKRLGDW